MFLIRTCLIQQRNLLRSFASPFSSGLQSSFDLANRIKELNDRKQFHKAIALFDRYQQERTEQISTFTVVQILKACEEIGDLQRGLTIFDRLPSAVKNQSSVVQSMINLHLKCGDVQNVQTLFDTSKNKTLHIYGAMMKGFIKNNMADKAIKLFHDIKNPDHVIFILLFNACAQLGTKEALELLRKVSKEVPRSLFSNARLMTSLVDGFMKCNDVENAELVFHATTNKPLEMFGAIMKGYIVNRMEYPP